MSVQRQFSLRVLFVLTTYVAILIFCVRNPLDNPNLFLVGLILVEGGLVTGLLFAFGEKNWLIRGGLALLLLFAFFAIATLLRVALK